jgi:hypothetical protein
VNYAPPLERAQIVFPPPAPITRLSDIAAMALKGFTDTKLSDQAGVVNERMSCERAKATVAN